jgi:LmeA-like phospholipid-binding
MAQQIVPARRRRISGKVWALIIVPLVILGILFGIDRAAAAITASAIAAKIQSSGFPVEPSVSVEGFPFLTQLISGHLDGVTITAPSVPAGPVTTSINARATGITLGANYQSGTIAHVTGTGLIAFSGLANLAAHEGVPGLKVSRAGPHTVNLSDLAATGVAQVIKTGPDQLSFSILRSNIPFSLLGPIRHLTVTIPRLPLGLSVRTVAVTARGVVIGVAGTNVSFGK